MEQLHSEGTSHLTSLLKWRNLVSKSTDNTPPGAAGLEKPRPSQGRQGPGHSTCLVGGAQARISAPTPPFSWRPCATHTVCNLLCSSNGRPGLPPGSAYLYPRASILSSSTSSKTSLGDDGAFTAWRLRSSIGEGDPKSSAIGPHTHPSPFLG